ncbi:MAG: nucleotide exchange factor GrpE [Pseudomonadota bacterium]|nr:MAG: nucleotide exchange factor GrpE [Pseudomonadota bacterium]
MSQNEELTTTGAQPAPEPDTVATPESTAGDELVKQLQADLEATRAHAAENIDRFMRAKAEMENVRRRAEQDVAAARKFGIERFAEELLAVRDSLDLARTVDIQADSASAVQKMREGLDLTLKLMDGAMQKFGVTVIDPQGEKFDPNRHQAISMVESGDVAPNHIVTVVQKGFLIHDRVLRPAMVIVAKAPASAGDQGEKA